MRTPKKINLPELSPKLAYICGVLAGDGYIGIRPNKNEYIVNCGGNPKDEIEFYDNILAPFFQKLFCIEVKPKLLGGKKKNKTYGFNIWSKNLVYFLLDDVGMTQSPKDNLLIPQKILDDRNLYLPFIKGVFDTDFCLKFKNNYPRIVGSSKCKAFMQQISDLLEGEGFRVLRYFDYKVKDSRLKKGYNIINKVEINGHNQLSLWLDKIGTNQPKNQEKIRKWRNEKVAGGGFEPPIFPRKLR